MRWPASSWRQFLVPRQLRHRFLYCRSVPFFLNSHSVRVWEDYSPSIEACTSLSPHARLRRCRRPQEHYREYRAFGAEDEPWREEVFAQELAAAFMAASILWVPPKLYNYDCRGPPLKFRPVVSPRSGWRAARSRSQVAAVRPRPFRCDLA